MKYYDLIYSLACFLLSRKTDADRPLVYAELGIRHGNTFNKVAPLVDVAHAVDKEDVARAISQNRNCQWHHTTTDEFIAQLTSERFDLVFIDADHSYSQSLKDFDGILPFVKDGGFILLHDTCPESDNLIIPAKCGEVYRTAWDIRTRYRERCEIVTLPGDEFGLSIVRKAHEKLSGRRGMPKIGVLIGSYDGTAEGIETLARPIKDCGHYTVIGYDAHERMPSADAVNSCDCFFSGGGWSGGGWGGKQSGELRNIRIGLELILARGCDYVLKINGDSIITKPGNIACLIDYLEANDVIASQWWDQCGTMIFFGKTEPLARIYSELPPAPPQIEKRFTAALNKNGIKYRVYECRAENQGIWGEVLGFRRRNENYNP